MGDVIYFNPKDKDPLDKVEPIIRESLDLLGDADSAPWVVETIRRLFNIPELKFQLNINLTGVVDEENAKETCENLVTNIKAQLEEIKFGMANAFITSYLEKKQREYLGD